MPFDCPPETVPEAALVLDRAADIVERGWCRFAMSKRRFGLFALPCVDHPSARRYCATGAICVAGLDLGLDVKPARDALGKFLYEKVGNACITIWNDSLRPWSTRHRVVAGLREARDRVIEADRLARDPRALGADRYVPVAGAGRREVVVA